MDGKNIADFIDPDIEAKLEALEREEEKLEKEGFYDEEEEIVRILFLLPYSRILTPLLPYSLPFLTFFSLTIPSRTPPPPHARLYLALASPTLALAYARRSTRKKKSSKRAQRAPRRPS